MAKNDRDQIRRLREEANALRQQAEAKKRRQRMIAQVGTIVGALVVVAIIVGFAIMAPQWFGNRHVPEASGNVKVTNTAGKDVEVPIALNNDGVTVGKQEAPDTIEYYLDFSCPHCREYHKAMDSTYQQLIGDGKIKVRYHFIRFVDDYGMRAASAMTAATEAEPAKFYQFVDDLFEVAPQTQVAWGEADYATHLQGLGVTNSGVIEAIQEGNYNWWILDRTRDARSSGVRGTPSIGLNGELLQNLPSPATIQYLLDGLSEEEAKAKAEPTETSKPSEEGESATETPTATETSAGQTQGSGE